MKPFKTTISGTEAGDFLSPKDYDILKGIIIAKQRLDIGELSLVMQKDLHYLAEILAMSVLRVFRVKKIAPTQFETDFKSGEEIVAFLAKLQELENARKSLLENKRPPSPSYYLDRRVATPLLVLLALFMFIYGSYTVFLQVQQHLPPEGFALMMFGVFFFIAAYALYSPFFSDGLVRTTHILEDHFKKCIPAYNTLLNILLFQGNVATLHQIRQKKLNLDPIQTLATFSTEGRRLLEWWKKRNIKVSSLIGRYQSQFPPEIIHYIPSLDLLIRPSRESLPTQLEEWQMDIFRGMIYLDKRIEIPRFTKLAQISPRYFYRVLYTIIASGTIKLDIKGETIEFHDEDQVNALIAQLQREFQQWTATTGPSP